MLKKSILFLFLISIMAADSSAQTFEQFLEQVNTAPVGQRQALVDGFMSRIAATPLIEGETMVHFLYRGEAGSVNVPGDFNSWDKGAFPMFRVEGTDLWHYSRSFGKDARLDYKFVTDGSRWILDPNNPLTCTGGFGPNSELRMPGYQPPPEIEIYPDIPHGSLQDTVFHSRHLGNARTIRVYLPPGYENSATRYPMILFHDGLEYVSLAGADRVLDYLIHHGRIEPTMAVFVPPVDRRGEYVDGRRAAFTRFILEEVVAWIDGRFRTDPRPGRRAVMGASNGGDISLWLGVSHPEVFGNVAAQSTTIKDDIFDRFRNGPKLDLKLYLDLGTYDIPGIIPMVRGFIPVLEEQGYQFQYGEYPEGHSWGLWRAHIDDALELFFPAGATSPEDAEAPAGRFEKLKQDLQTGSPEQKESALDTFAQEHPAGMVPAVIAATLDTTISPRHGDTGWGRVYHQAAMALAGFAQKIDGLSLKQRGRTEYSFYDDVGTASQTRRQEVHDGWLVWWRGAAGALRESEEKSPPPN